MAIFQENCTLGNSWIWYNIGQCVTDVTMLIGVVMAILSIPLWIFTTLTFYVTTRYCGYRHVTYILVAHWFTDIFSFIGCVLTEQLPLQILFALTCVVFTSTLLFHSMICMVTNSKSKLGDGTYVKSEAAKCICTSEYTGRVTSSCFGVISVLSVVAFCSVFGTNNQKSSISIEKSAMVKKAFSSTRIIKQPKRNLSAAIGYSFGAIATIMAWVTKTNDVIHSYRPHNSASVFWVIQTSAIFTDAFYVIGVLTQDTSSQFVLHVLPWVLARLGLIGINIGILVQRALLHKQVQRKQLESECSKMLHSSSSETEWTEEETEIDLGIAASPRPPPISQYSSLHHFKRNHERTYISQDLTVYTNQGTADSSGSTSTGKPELEWDFEYPVTAFNGPLPQGISTFETVSTPSHEKVVEWFKRSGDTAK